STQFFHVGEFASSKSAMKTCAPEFSALIIILRSTGPVISTRRSRRSAGASGTRQSDSRTLRVSGRKSGSSPARSRCQRSARAAEALFVTQPALTARLNALERALGTTLLVRRRGGVRPTESGRAFLPYAERALAAVAEGRAALAGGGVRLAIGASPAVSTYAL